jgi:hypothetical protein
MSATKKSFNQEQNLAAAALASSSSKASKSTI